ncbi:MAG: manganese efflux pump [Actinobacteria bacterium]|nr:manganese efflux pump [Actinomycetota bacterium]MBO0833959.1 manganese efflux pump [Actinomycetota bacterium]
MFKLLAFVLPLGLDSFAVAAAMGAAGVTGWRAGLRISAIFVVFEAGMPLIGLAAGSGVARAIGPVADYVAAAAVIAVGVWMLVSRDDDEERVGRIAGSTGLAVVALGVSISTDELAIGFSLGLTGLPVVPVIVAIGIQALVASQLGLALGAMVSARLREHAEQVAGLALIALGCYLIVQRAIS